MRDETAKDNRQTTALISHDMTRNNELAFSSTRNLQFYCFQIVKFFSLDFGFGIPKEKIWMTFYGKAILNQEDRISRSDTARQHVWEWEKWANHKQFSSALVSSAVQMVMLVGCDWWFSIRIFFVAEKPLPMGRTCTIVNFHNLHSLLGQFSNLVFEKTKSSDWCWFVVKNSFFRQIQRENWRFLLEEGASSLFCIKLWLIPCAICLLSFAVSFRIRLVAKQ